MLRQGCQSYIQPVKGKFLNTFFEIYFCIFSPLWSKNNSHFWKKSLGRVFKTAFYVSEGQFDKFLKTVVIFLITSDFKQKMIRILAKEFRQAFQNCHLPVRKKFLGKNFFRKILFSLLEYFYSLTKTVSGFLAKNYRQACRNSIPCVKRNVLRKIFSGKKVRIFKDFQKLDGRIFDFNQNFPAVSSKLQPTCAKEYFD